MLTLQRLKGLCPLCSQRRRCAPSHPPPPGVCVVAVLVPARQRCCVVVQTAGSRRGKYQPCDLTVSLNGWLWTGFFQAEHNEMSVQTWPRRLGPNTALVFRLPAALSRLHALLCLLRLRTHRRAGRGPVSAAVP